MHVLTVLFGTHITLYKYHLEKVHRRTARWVLSDYNYHNSVSTMLHGTAQLVAISKEKEATNTKHLLPNNSQHDRLIST